MNAVRLSLLALLGLTACVVDQAGDLPDAATIDASIDATPVCAPVSTALESGHHVTRYDYQNGSSGCMGVCHDGVLGPVWTIGGSLFDRYRTGGNPVAGAKIVVIDSRGKEVEMVTAQNGMFWTNEMVTPPLRTYASACPDSMPMIDNTNGNCNLGSCHGEDIKIFVPGPLAPL